MSRPPTDVEREVLLKLLEQQRRRFADGWANPWEVATGKTGLSIRVAEALHAEGIGAEIISADSRQVYRGLDIGTAKATPAVVNINSR